jgi:SAM-dependent methyltransferase
MRCEPVAILQSSLAHRRRLFIRCSFDWPALKRLLKAGLALSPKEGSVFMRRLPAFQNIMKLKFWPQPTAPMQSLDVRGGYRRWASTYADETVASILDQELAEVMLAERPQGQLLDAGCGVGRRIKGMPNAVGIDLSPEMIAAGDLPNIEVGDVCSMSFPDARFDTVWCRLVLGHLSDLASAYRELARVCRPGGYVFITDFHPDAAAAGHRRTFTTEEGVTYGIEHYVHMDHEERAAAAGLMLVTKSEGAVGPSVRECYVRGIGLRQYKKDLGLNLVLAYLFQKQGGIA